MNDCLGITERVTTIDGVRVLHDAYVACDEVALIGSLYLEAGRSATNQFITLGGSDRSVFLPAAETGLAYVIFNVDSANTLTIYDYNGTAVTGATVAFGTYKTLIYSGTAWRVA